MNYNEKLEEAKKLYEIANPDQKYVLESLFPELTENEDEKVRKALIRYFTLSDEHAYNEACGVSYRDIVAWLKAQGEQKSLDDVAKEITKNKKNAISFLKSCGIMNANGELADEYKIEQDEQKSEEVDNLHNYLYGEQKPADKIETKFKVGDCIVECVDASTWLITKVFTTEENIIAYNMINQEGRTLVIGSHNIDYRYHLWAIQDAKDGDVLTDAETIFIFKSLCDDGSVMTYCDYDGDDFTGLSMNLMCANICPATKEQRDLLFQKMKDAGYEWDAEKKELKKIEQNPDKWEPQTGDTFRKKGTISPTYHLCNKREDGITFGFVENREEGISGGEITIYALKQGYELVERPKSIEDAVEEELNKCFQTEVGKNPDDNIETSAFKDKLLELFQRFRWYCKDETPTNGDIVDYVDAHIQELIDTIKNEPN